MDISKDCLICGAALSYRETAAEHLCNYCRQAFTANISCPAGHFICDNCHSASANELIKTYCLTEAATDPVAMAIHLMHSPQIKMHGPEHHFLVPAVLLAAYYNHKQKPSEKAAKLAEAEKRARNVLGGFCGFYGACGAGVGVGIFVSLITGSTPLAQTTWSQSNLATACALQSIAGFSGPRCCKRDSFLAILAAADFLHNVFNTALPVKQAITCEFFSQNSECLQTRCSFYTGE